MPEMYDLYLYLFAVSGAGDHEAFSAALTDALSVAGHDTVKAIEVNATAAIASVKSSLFSVAGSVYGTSGSGLLDFYGFQQVWQKYRTTAVMQ